MPNKAEIARRFTRALPVYGQHAKAQAQIAARLLELLLEYAPPNAARALEIGSGSGIYSRLLQNSLAIKEWHFNDLCPAARAYAQHGRFLGGDIETLPLNTQYDLITSASAFQWLSDPQALLHKLHACLKSGGLLAFNTFAPGNLVQIKSLTGAGLHYPDPAAWHVFLQQSGFSVLHSGEETIVLHFNRPQDVLRHLQHTGVTATQPYSWTPARMRRFCAEYRERYARNGLFPLTYTPLYILAGKP